MYAGKYWYGDSCNTCSILKTVFRVCGKDGDGVIYAIYRKQMNGRV